MMYRTKKEMEDLMKQREYQESENKQQKGEKIRTVKMNSRKRKTTNNRKRRSSGDNYY